MRERKVKERKICGIHSRCGELKGGEEGCSVCSVLELGKGLHDWVWRRRGSGEGLQLNYLFSLVCPACVFQGIPSNVGG